MRLFLSFGEGLGVRLYLSFGEGSGVRLFVLSGLCFNLNQPSPQDYSCRFEIFVFGNYQTTEPSEASHSCPPRAIRVRHTPAARPTGLFAVIRMISVL